MFKATYHNPYYNQNFFEFFWQLILRIFGFVKGEFGIKELASDEVQMIVLMFVAISTALVGTFLVLRRMTMLANSLSHTILIGIVVVFVFTTNGVLSQGSIQAMLIAAVVTGLITAYLTEFLTKTVKLQVDASTGIVFTTLFAIGIILVTLLTRNAHIGTEVVMGNTDALHIDDCKLVGIIILLNLFVSILFFKEYKITTFDPALAKALGISVAISENSPHTN